MLARLTWVIGLIGILGLCGCGGEEDNSDVESILSYAGQTGLNFQTTNSGIYFDINAQGSGEAAGELGTALIHIRVFRMSGQVLINTFGVIPAVISLEGNTGLIEAVRMLNEGGQGTFVLPTGYNTGIGGVESVIPVGMDIQLIDVTSDEEQLAQNITDIETYITALGLDAQKTESNLYYVIDSLGDGDKPGPETTVTVHYKGYLLDGTQFDSSFDRGTPSSFGLTQVIAGWTEGLQLFERGGGGKLLIPYTLGYGSVGQAPEILPYSVLVFDIELIDF